MYETVYILYYLYEFVYITLRFVSSDGEHENVRGTRILAREFGKVLNGWLTTDAGEG